MDKQIKYEGLIELSVSGGENNYVDLPHFWRIKAIGISWAPDCDLCAVLVRGSEELFNLDQKWLRMGFIPVDSQRNAPDEFKLMLRARGPTTISVMCVVEK